MAIDSPMDRHNIAAGYDGRKILEDPRKRVNEYLGPIHLDRNLSRTVYEVISGRIKCVASQYVRSSPSGVNHVPGPVEVEQRIRV